MIELSPTYSVKNEDHNIFTPEGIGCQHLPLVIKRDEAYWQTCGCMEELEHQRQIEITIEKPSDRHLVSYCRC